MRREGGLSRAMIEITPDDTTKIKSNTSAKIKSKYSVEYLKKMVSAGKLADKVTVHFNQDYPLKIDYVVQDRLSLSFILAPRVDNDWVMTLYTKSVYAPSETTDGVRVCVMSRLTEDDGKTPVMDLVEGKLFEYWAKKLAPPPDLVGSW